MGCGSSVQPAQPAQPHLRARRVGESWAVRPPVRATSAPAEWKCPPRIPPRKSVTKSVPCGASLDECISSCHAAVDSILKALQEGEKYSDPTWSPEIDQTSVLYLNGHTGCYGCTVGVPHSWKRLSDVCGSPLLIRDGLCATDVRQGGLGDCFLLSAVAAVASARSDLLQSLFVQFDVQRGVYGVRLFVNGAWSYVVVDDYIAYDADGRKTYASSCDDNELWLPILEKAFAKACCCFENIDGGLTSWALEVLTGGLADPRDELTVGDHGPDALWRLVGDLLERGDILALGSYSDNEYVAQEGVAFTSGNGTAGEGVLACGIVAGHAYALLGQTEYEGTRLYKIRNPWGMGEWNGAWSDLSKEMTEDARLALGQTVANDGIFFMSCSDFSRLWESVSTVRLWDKSWALSSANGFFFRGAKVAVAEEAYEGEDEDELSLTEGDRVQLADCQHPDWWMGVKLAAGEVASRHGRRGDGCATSPKSFPKRVVALAEGVGGCRRFDLSAASPTEAIVVLLQPDIKTRRSYAFSKEVKGDVKVSNYSYINLTVTRGQGQATEVIASGEGEVHSAPRKPRPTFKSPTLTTVATLYAGAKTCSECQARSDTRPALSGRLRLHRREVPGEYA